ncbi:MAG: type II toxin-antitoxin system Phd/YefM family antitoxin [Oscillatoriales cyanobacterium RU_3_3]|nr:type II toxin-antitoxin system Phd/YefM family antitoxin [Microcoleus sp. SU_5_6]NJM61137.1 type II toxin-antitoxin system Phd/YefM family antitoxin [Oscillatoriales cyanobacterium RU_3_3]NJR25855.1 type II toxin-antitoxin system Phd/YefM family antitoxin [Richelia sp. CSU_2_1]
MYQVDIEEAKEKLLELIEAAMRGEEVAIAKDNQPVVKLVALPKKDKPDRKAGSAKGMVWMSDDFDEPLEEFKEYME